MGLVLESDNDGPNEAILAAAELGQPEVSPLAHDGPGAEPTEPDGLTGDTNLDGPGSLPGLDAGRVNEAEDDINAGVDALFCTHAAPIVVQPPVRHPRQRRAFDMTALRRSARLAKKPAMPAAERAQRNLWRKLGLADDELAPVEAVLAEFIGMFTRPLPEHIIAAMTTIFGLDDDGADMLNEALLEHAAEGVDDLLGEEGPVAA
ncbi:unnamed protein product [Urochloa humidicola]